MNSIVKRLTLVVAASVVVASCSNHGDPTGPGAVHKSSLRQVAECGEATYLMALSSALPEWEDSIETWKANPALLNTAPAFTGQSTADYLTALVPVLQQWESSLDTLGAPVDSVADFNAATSDRQAYLTGLASVLASWETVLETSRGSDFLPTPPAFVADATAPEITCPADTTISSEDSLVVVNFEVTAIDDCDPAPVVTSVPPSGSEFPVGETVVTSTAVDSLGNESSCTFTVTVGPGGGSNAPEITCPDDFTVSCAPEEGVEVEFEVTAVDDNDPAPVVTSVPPSGSVFPVGETLVTSTAVDADGNESSCTFTVTVEEAENGELTSARAIPNVLWPPNHRWVNVRLDVDMDGGCVDGSDISWTVTRVTSNEAINGNGDGDTSPDWIITDNGVKLRAERSGTGNGRVYTVYFEGDDGTEGSVRVRVPHNR